MTENQEKTNKEVMADAIEALPDAMSDKEITSLFMTICMMYGISPDKVVMICAAMVETVAVGEYEAVLAMAEEEKWNEEDEG